MRALCVFSARHLDRSMFYASFSKPFEVGKAVPCVLFIYLFFSVRCVPGSVVATRTRPLSGPARVGGAAGKRHASILLSGEFAIISYFLFLFFVFLRFLLNLSIVLGVTLRFALRFSHRKWGGKYIRLWLVVLAVFSRIRGGACCTFFGRHEYAKTRKTKAKRNGTKRNDTKQKNGQRKMCTLSLSLDACERWIVYVGWGGDHLHFLCPRRLTVSLCFPKGKGF